MELVAWMVPVGLGGGTAMPSATALLLSWSPPHRAGIASGVLNTSRQVGGALGVAVFGALLGGLGAELGLRVSLGIAGSLLLLTTVASARLPAKAGSGTPTA
ncbi:MAG: hypothetical protein VX899_25470 [Myxococcota bacterium]|nr:hypothetical protein [Myxococcota bacterium]